MTERSNDGLFEWDSDKDRINLKKHGLSFREAVGIFKDPYRVEYFDEQHSTVDEDRFVTLGRLPDKIVIAVVISTERGGLTRIISARYASERETRLYYAG